MIGGNFLFVSFFDFLFFHFSGWELEFPRSSGPRVGSGREGDAHLVVLSCIET